MITRQLSQAITEDLNTTLVGLNNVTDLAQIEPLAIHISALNGIMETCNRLYHPGIASRAHNTEILNTLNEQLAAAEAVTGRSISESTRFYLDRLIAEYTA